MKESRNAAHGEGNAYWAAHWDAAPPRRVARDYRLERLARWFDTYLQQPPPWSVLELGCGGSVWLPYFAERGATALAGIDFTREGIALARRNLVGASAGIDADLELADIRERVPRFVGRFDTVVSFGTIEHLPDPRETLRHACAYLKPGGRIFSLLPNVYFFYRTLQWLVDRAVLYEHHWTGLEALRTFHEEAGFATLACAYSNTFDLGLIDKRHGGWTLFFLRVVFSKITGAVWRASRLLRWHPESFLFSPYLIYIGARPGDAV